MNAERPVQWPQKNTKSTKCIVAHLVREYTMQVLRRLLFVAALPCCLTPETSHLKPETICRA
jgi:hypothetical protein